MTPYDTILHTSAQDGERYCNLSRLELTRACQGRDSEKDLAADVAKLTGLRLAAILMSILFLLLFMIHGAIVTQ